MGILFRETNAPFWITLPAAAVVGALLGIIFGLPSLRLRHGRCPTAREGEHRALLRNVLAVENELVIVPAQDLLGLGSEARLNTPGIAEGNWAWRLREGAFDDALVARLRRLTEVSERLAPPEAPAADEGPQPVQNS